MSEEQSEQASLPGVNLEDIAGQIKPANTLATVRALFDAPLEGDTA